MVKKARFLDFVCLWALIWWETDKLKFHTPLASDKDIFLCIQKIFYGHAEISEKKIRPQAKKLILAPFFSKRL